MSKLNFIVSNQSIELTTQVNDFLANHPLNAQLSNENFKLSVFCSSDDETNVATSMKWRKRRLSFEGKVGCCDYTFYSDITDKDISTLVEILVDLTSKYEIKFIYNSLVFSAKSYCFTIAQQKAILKDGANLIVNPLYFDEDDVEDDTRIMNIYVNKIIKEKTWEEINLIDNSSADAPVEVKQRALSLNVEFSKNNKNFYPTPASLCKRMLSKLDMSSKRNIKNIIDPSGGKGDLLISAKQYAKVFISYISEPFKFCSFFAIEKDIELQATLRGKNIDVLDSDFLHYNGLEQFDVILMNPPFDNGDKHLHKALDIMFEGQIVCLLNSNTLKNPYSNERKRLIQRLKELDAEIEYIPNAFDDIDSQRKTGVEVALIYINIEKTVEHDLFGSMNEEELLETEELGGCKELQTKNNMENLVIEYNATREKVTGIIIDFYKNNKLTKDYLELMITSDTENYDKSSITKMLKAKLNKFNAKIKVSFWRKTLELDEIKSRLTNNYRQKVENMLTEYTKMEFTVSNIRQLVLNIIDEYPKMIEGSITSMFNMMTEHALRDNSRWGYKECENNIYLYNAWKTNNGYKVNKKVIIPFSGLLNSSGEFQIDGQVSPVLEDFERVMQYFDGKIKPTTFTKMINHGLQVLKISKKIDTEYFIVNIHKKGTIHFEFKDLDILRRFNIEVGKSKGWLPFDYSYKAYGNLNDEEKEIVNNFENSKKEYSPIQSVYLSLDNPMSNFLLPESPDTTRDDEVDVLDEMIEEEGSVEVIIDTLQNAS